MRIARTLALTAFLGAAVVGCGTNPVTGEREVQFISEEQELQIGEQQYKPARQSQGGRYDTLPGLTDYVDKVGQRLAEAADRDLPYEFVVLNNSQPNAWALPGGKIAVNRGLLAELDNEAELAAVLAHEIVHAAARHGAQSQERGTLLQLGMVAAGIGAAVGGADPDLSNLILGGANVGAQLLNLKYSREAELEADRYGMEYMKAAGYDPQAAVTLQQKFVELAQSSGSNERNWLGGLFASHPPSQERVEANRATAAQLGTGGEIGEDRYARNLAPLRELQPAYDKYDEALAAAQEGRMDQARSFAQQAADAAPREARFHQLLGDIARHQGNMDRATGYYREAIELDPAYFAPYVGGGVALYEQGRKPEARDWLQQSMKRLPTAPAAYYLANIARDNGNTNRAVELYSMAAGSNTAVGQAAQKALAELDAPRNPNKYIATAPQLDASGRLLLVLENRGPVAMTRLVVTPVLVNSAGQVVQQAGPVRIDQAVQPGQRIAVDAGVGRIDPQTMDAVRFRIDRARPAG